MGWIQERLRQNPQTSTEDQSQEQFSAAARERWQKLGEELRSDVADFNSHQPGSEFTQDHENRFRVINSRAGVELTSQS